MYKFASVVLALAIATPVMAQAPTGATPPAAAPVKADPLDKIVCRTEEGLGSRLNRKKVCMSLRDWKDQADDARDATGRLQQLTQNPKSG